MLFFLIKKVIGYIIFIIYIYIYLETLKHS